MKRRRRIKISQIIMAGKEMVRVMYYPRTVMKNKRILRGRSKS